MYIIFEKKKHMCSFLTQRNSKDVVGSVDHGGLASGGFDKGNEGDEAKQLEVCGSDMFVNTVSQKQAYASSYGLFTFYSQSRIPLISPIIVTVIPTVDQRDINVNGQLTVSLD